MHAAPVRRMAFSADGRELITVSGDRLKGFPASVTRWDIAAGTSQPGVPMPSDESPSWTLLANGNLALQRTGMNSLAVWNTFKGRPARSDLSGRAVRSYRVSPDGSESAGSGNRRCGVPVANGCGICRAGPASRPDIPTLAANGEFAAFQVADNAVTLRSMTSPQASGPSGTNFKIVTLAFPPMAPAWVLPAPV